MKKKLHICSFGMKPSDISLETLNILQNAGAVISDALKDDGKISKICKNFIFASHDKVNLEGVSKAENEIAKALSKNKDTVYFTCGNPMFLNRIHEKIAEKFSQADIKLYPALSSFDYVVQFLRKEYGVDDFDCVFLMRPRYFPKEYSFSPLVVFNPFSLLKDKKVFDNFFSLISSYYPENHLCSLIKISAYPDYSFSHKTFSVKNFVKFLKSVTPEDTLYVPACSKKKTEYMPDNW